MASGPMKCRNRPPRKKLAIPYMVKGLMTQLTNRVKPTGRPVRPAWTTLAKSIFTMMGYIMKKRQTAMGMDTTGASLTWMARPSR